MSSDWNILKKKRGLCDYFDYCFTGSWRKSWRVCDHKLACELDPGISRVLTPTFALGMYVLPTVPTAGAVFRFSLETVMLNHMDWIYDWTSLRVLWKLFKILATGCGYLFIFRPTKTSLIHKLSCFWKLPSTDLKWSASCLSFSLPSLYGGQFATDTVFFHLGMFTLKM